MSNTCGGKVNCQPSAIGTIRVMDNTEASLKFGSILRLCFIIDGKTARHKL